MTARVGLRVSRADRKKRIKELLKLGLSRVAIAQRLGCDVKTVSNLMSKKV